MRGYQLTDEQLVARCQAEPASPQRAQWLNELFDRHYDRVACWCLRLTGNPAAAADLAQEVFLKAYRHLDTFQGNSKFATWLFSITRNRFLDETKTRSIRPEVSGGEALAYTAETRYGDPYAWIERQDSVRVMWELIHGTLEELEKKVLTLHYLNDLPFDAITRLLGLKNTSGAKAYVVSARRKLARALLRQKARDERVTKMTQPNYG